MATNEQEKRANFNVYHKPVCVKCEIAYYPKKNGVRLLDMFQDNKSYKLYNADLWECPHCGNQIVVGFGDYGIDHNDEPKFSDSIGFAETHGMLVKCNER